MATAFKQVKNGAKTVTVSNALNNTTSPLTFSVQAGTGTKFPSPGNGFYVTAYNSTLYGDPNDDPNMRIGLCTARTVDSLTVTWGQLGTSITAVTGTPDLRLIMVDQLLIDLYTAINALESAGYITGSSPAITGTVTGGASYTAPTLTSPTISGTVGGTATFGGITINSPTIVTPTIASFTNAAHDHTNAAGGGALGASTVGSTQVITGVPVQIVSTNFSAVATGTTLIPQDDTIPQITEGDQYMTQAITPKSATNRLSIEATVFCSSSVATDLTVALFQDATANALAATDQFQATATGLVSLKLTHDMVAGTTSSTTFRIRVGGPSAGTTTFNGRSGARFYGGITLSNIKVTEYKV